MPQVYLVVWPMLYSVHIFILANHKMHHIIIPITEQSSNPEYPRSALVLLNNMISIFMLKFLKTWHQFVETRYMGSKKRHI